VNPDPLKPAWQAQPRPSIDPELLLAEVRRNQRWFAAALFWRDVREVGVGLLMVPLWVYLGSALALPWTWYLMLPTLVWVPGFLLVDRFRRRRRPPDPGEPLVRCVQESLAQVEHQIWLLRNVGWWGLLPFAVPAMAFIGHVGWQVSGAGWMTAVIIAGVSAVVGLILAVLYRVNQAAVRKELEPRRRELQALLAGLGNPPPDDQGTVTSRP
jgi:hypothetical protein